MFSKFESGSDKKTRFESKSLLKGFIYKYIPSDLAKVWSIIKIYKYIYIYISLKLNMRTNEKLIEQPCYWTNLTGTIPSVLITS